MNKYKRFIETRKRCLKLEKRLDDLENGRVMNFQRLTDDPRTEKEILLSEYTELYNSFELQKQSMNLPEKVLTFIISGEWKYWEGKNG